MQSTCSQPSLESDSAVIMFFQVETNNVNGASFSCARHDAPDTPICSRNWKNSSESGAAGSCYFLLPAKTPFTCTSSGGAVNIIDSNYELLAAPALVANTVPVACPGGTLDSSSSCQLTPDAITDRWIQSAWSGGGGPDGGAFECTIAGSTSTPLCSWSSDSAGPSDGSSCAFLLPAAKTLSCKATRGTVKFTPSHAVALLEPLIGAAPEAPVTCPPSSPNPNDCDCSFDNNSTISDALVIITSRSADDNFNSFHCFYDGSNVCGWGSNVDSRGSAGGCSFILPAGETYTCTMEWGAAAFPLVTIIPALRSLFSVPNKKNTLLLSSGIKPPTPFGGSERLLRLWAAWQIEHDVSFDDATLAADGFEAFTAHVAAADAAVVRLIDAQHLDKNGLPTRFNKFAATPRIQWEKSYGGIPGRKMSQSLRRSGNFAAQVPPSPSPPPPPPSVDWRSKGVVTPVKDQGQCGSCWSFSTSGSVESAWSVAGNALTSLSEQNLVSCDNTSFGCDGGYPNTAMDWTAANGAITEASWPYESGGGTAPPCTTQGHQRAAVNVTGWRLVPGNTSLATEIEMKAWLAAYGPVSILVDAMTQLWWPYVSGIMTGCCDTSTDHAVLLVGFNSTAPVPYWIVKNSWGESWGESGYVRIAMGDNECGIGSFPVIPTVSGGVLPPPPPPPPPRPVWECPSGSKSVNTTDSASCMWTNGTSPDWWMPTNTVEGDCTYINLGYMGYTFSGKLEQSSYPCPPAFSAEGDGGAAWFCMLESGNPGFTNFPQNSTADCSNIANGIFGYSWKL